MKQVSKHGKLVSKKTDIEVTQEISWELARGKPYIAVTHDVHVTVWPEFIDSKISQVGDLFVWVYHVRIDNKSQNVIKLVNRYWRIIDEKGIVQEVNGEGVVGEQPVITPNGSHQYSSGVHLRYPSGIMSGQYQMQRVDIVSNLDAAEVIGASPTQNFNVKIPSFSLDVPGMQHMIN